MKLEDVYGNKSFTYSRLIEDKKFNESRISELQKSLNTENSDFMRGWIRAKIDSALAFNKDVKRRMRIEMGVLK